MKKKKNIYSEKSRKFQYLSLEKANSWPIITMIKEDGSKTHKNYYMKVTLILCSEEHSNISIPSFEYSKISCLRDLSKT